MPLAFLCVSLGACLGSSAVLRPALALPLALQVILNPEPERAEPTLSDNEPDQPLLGPMRLEPLRLIDNRVWAADPKPDQPGGSALKVQVKLTGERLPEVVRAGQFVIESAVDDTGAELVDPEAIKPRQRDVTQAITMNPRTLKQGFLLKEGSLNSPARSATNIKALRGYVNVVYATETEDVVIDNPLQFEGGLVANPRLSEIGVQVRVLKLGEEADEPGDGRGIAIKFTEGEEAVRGVGLYDGWYRRLNARPRAGKTDDEKRYTYFAVAGGRIDADSQMIISVFPNIEREKVEFTGADLRLP